MQHGGAHDFAQCRSWTVSTGTPDASVPTCGTTRMSRLIPFYHCARPPGAQSMRDPPAIGTAAPALSCAPTPRVPARRRTGRDRRRASLPGRHRPRPCDGTRSRSVSVLPRDGGTCSGGFWTEDARRHLSHTRTAAPGCITLADRTLAGGATPYVGNRVFVRREQGAKRAIPPSVDASGDIDAMRGRGGSGGLRPCCSLHARRKLGTRAEQPASLGRSYRDGSPRPLSRHLSGGV